MRMIYLLLLTLIAAPVWAVPLDLNYGVNEVDINADGVKDMIVRSRWENGNAHSFDKYLVMVRLKDEFHTHGVYEVPLGEGWDYRFLTDEGADCLRVGYRFELNKQGMLEVQRYAAEGGKEFYCEPQMVTLTTYRLTDGVKEEGVEAPSVAPFYLKQVKTQKLGIYGDVSVWMNP